MISVCLATYNGEKYIKEQLDSIIKQLNDDDEIVVSDDGSSDDTIKLIESFNDKRIKIYRNEGRHGFTPNFENALRHSKGEFIFLADQDDIWHNNKVTLILEELKYNDFVITDCRTFLDSTREIISISRFRDFSIKPGFMRHLIKSRFLGCCMAFKRKVLDVSLPFPSNYFLLEHDIWLAAVGFLFFKVKLIDRPLLDYRRHDNNASSGGFTKGYSKCVKIKKRVYRLCMLVLCVHKVINLFIHDRVSK